MTHTGKTTQQDNTTQPDQNIQNIEDVQLKLEGLRLLALGDNVLIRATATNLGSKTLDGVSLILDSSNSLEPLLATQDFEQNWLAPDYEKLVFSIGRLDPNQPKVLEVSFDAIHVDEFAFVEWTMSASNSELVTERHDLKIEPRETKGSTSVSKQRESPDVKKVADKSATYYFFTMSNSPICRQMQAEVEELYRRGFSVMKIDGQIHPDWCEAFNVTTFPTVVLVDGRQVLNRWSGMINSSKLESWFSKVGRQSTNTDNPEGSVPLTVLDGTSIPASQFEERALKSTVRIKVTSQGETGWATGTVVDNHGDDFLVISCGHVFRDLEKNGRIEIEFNLDRENVLTSRGSLVFSDDKFRDIAALSFSDARCKIQPVKISEVDQAPIQNDLVFSIGCSKGKPPTIRRSILKRTLSYNGIKKYDIVGRPIDGRSGGGLFSKNGELFGICNAAAIHEDEGIFVAVDTIHWLLKTIHIDIKQSK